mgnify:CR=1 FL=1
MDNYLNIDNINIDTLYLQSIDAEDAINLISSNSLIRYISISDAKSDAIDVDFGSFKKGFEILSKYGIKF